MRNIFLALLLSSLIYTSSSAQEEGFSTIDFSKADKIASLLKVKKLTNLPKLAYNLTHTLNTPVEKFRAIYTWVSLNIDSDYYYQEKVMNARQKLAKDSLALRMWDKENQKKFFKKLTNQKQTVCTGYAYLIKELAGLVGIECKIIDGYGRNVALNIEKLGVPNHSWNAVKLNQKWYVCDATWSSGYTLITSESTNFIHKYNDGYFLTNPELFVKNHYPLNKKWTLLESPPSSQEFLKAPFIYDETFINKIIPLEPKKLMTTIKESQFLNFKFKTLKKIDRKKIKLEIINRSSKKIVDPIFMYSPKDDIITFKYQFTKKGKFDVHVKIDEDIISTFTVKNKKSNKK